MNQTKLGKHTICFLNKEEYHIIKNEVFTSDTYFFNLKNEKPFILDIGAHIGLTTIYFKDLFPNAVIHAYEPNPKVFKILKENIFINDMQDIHPHNMAVWVSEGTAKLNIDIDDWHSTSSFLKNSWQGTQKTESIRVHTVTLSSLLAQPVDILKIDIEGIEEKVLSGAEKLLGNVQNIVVEYHPTTGNSLEKIINILSSSGFSIEYYEEGKKVKRPDRKRLTILKGTRI